MVKRIPANIDQNLRLGIEAARTGHERKAREFLLAVLKQDPDNIAAMLWLAFVLTSPHDTIRVLRRVLTLDPNNERAKAGIQWAQARLEQAAPETEPQSPVDSPPTEEEESPASPDIRQQILSGKVKKQARKGVLAHRARRTIRPLMAILVVSGVLGLTAIALGALAFVPPETLAAWLPASAVNLPAQSQEALPAIPDQSLAAPEAIVVKDFVSRSDTLTLAAPSIPPVLIEPALPPVELGSVRPEFEPPVLAETNLSVLEPANLIGPPEQPLISDDLQVPVMVDNLSLAHQPAYPGEKWIEVNLTAQQVIAWEGDQPVFSFMASTGLPNTPTVLGEFHIYWKLSATLMTGPGYYLPEVPYTMYFYGGYALHGTYWHNNFGQPMSHGCVNLETGNAQKLFEWAEPIIPPGQSQVVSSADNPGTLVVVHY
jgi:hypothetical protein